MKHWRKRLILLAIVILASMLALNGCSSLARRPLQTGNEGEEGAYAYVLYFADNQAVQSDERCSFTGYTKAVERRANEPVFVSASVLQELINGPDPQEDHVGPVLPPDTRVLELTEDGGIVHINLSADVYPETIESDLAGDVFRDAIILTITQFPTIVRTQVLVEGEPWAHGDFVWDTPIGQYEILPAS